MLAASWMGWQGAPMKTDEDAPGLPPYGKAVGFRHQAALAFDCALTYTATGLQAGISNITAAAIASTEAVVLEVCVQPTVLKGLVSAVQVPAGADLTNARALAALQLEEEDASLILGLYEAACALQAAAMLAYDAAAAGKALSADTMATLVRGGLACLTFAHAESAAAGAAAAAGAGFRRPTTHPVQGLRHLGAQVLLHQASVITLPLQRQLAAKGVVSALLEAVPWEPTSEEFASSGWQAAETTWMGLDALWALLGVIFRYDAASGRAALRSGEWAAALQRIRDKLQLDSSDRRWQMWQQLDVSIRVNSKVGPPADSRRRPDAGAVAAAERAMQELLAGEEAGAASASNNSGKPSKAVAKRARKKAARQAAAAA